MSLVFPGDAPIPREPSSNLDASSSVHTPSSNHPVPASRPRLWGDASQRAYISRATTVGPSGKSLIIGFADSVGNSTSVLNLITTTSERVKVSGASGTFTLSFGGQTTAPIARGALPADVRAALSALSSIGTGNVSVSGPSGGPWLVSFINNMGNQPQVLMTINTLGIITTALSVPATPGTTARIDVDNNTPAWSSLGNWLPMSYGLSGTHRSLAAQGNGDNYAVWTFTGIAPGTYRVLVNWDYAPTEVQSTFSPSAPYRLYDGTVYRGTYRADQTARPIRDDPSGMQALTSVFIGNGTFQVVLSDDTTGNLCADQVSIVPVDPAAATTGDENNGVFVGIWDAQGNGYAFPSHETHLPSSLNVSTTAYIGGLTPGTYSLQTTWWAKSTRSRQAAYQIFDGSATTPVLTATVDQTQNPTGGLTLKVNAFQPIGTVRCASGRLRIVLSAPDSDVKTLSSDAIAAIAVSADRFTEAATGSVAFFSSGQPPKISVDNKAPVALTNPIWHTPTDPGDLDALPYVIYPLSFTIAPQSTVKLTLDDNTISTVTGPVSGVTALSVTNSSGRTILTPPTQKTMRVGYNMHTPNATGTVFYSNLMKGAGDWQWIGSLEGQYTSTGYPIVPGPTTLLTMIRVGPANMADPRGYSNGQFGNYTVFYDGDGSGTIDIYANPGLLYSVVSSDTGHATNNKVVFRLSPDNTVNPLPYFAGFGLVVRATRAGTPATNIRIYDPSIDLANIAKFHPQAVAQHTGAKALRNAFSLGANASSIVAWSDYPTPSQRSFNANDQRKRVFQIVTIDQYNGTDGFLPNDHDHLLVTLDRAHGLGTGQAVTVYPPPTGPEPNRIHVRTASGGFAGLEYYLGNVVYNSATMQPNQVAMGTTDSVAKSAVTTTYTFGGRIEVGTPSMAPADYVEFVNLLPDCDVYMNIPPAASDDLVTQLFTMVKTNLAPGRKIYAELSNEHWNPGLGYPQFFYYTGISQQAGQSGPTYGYVMRSGHVFAIAATALGNRATDFRRIYGSLSAVTEITRLIFLYTQPNNFPVDVLAIAPYTESYPKREAPDAAVTAALDVDQILDVLEQYLTLETRRIRDCEPHYAMLAAAYPNAVLADYEGSIAGAGLAVADLIYAKQSQAAWHHPRFFNMYTQYFNMLQKGHVALHLHLTHAQAFIAEGSNPSTLYGAWQSWNQAAGKNDGTGPNGYDVRPDVAGVPPGPADQSKANSVVGAAIQAWGASANRSTKTNHPVTLRRTRGRLTRGSRR